MNTGKPKPPGAARKAAPHRRGAAPARPGTDALPPIEVDGSVLPPLGMDPTVFLRDYWQKRPLLVRNAFPGLHSPLQPEDLAGLACEEGTLSPRAGGGVHGIRAPGLTAGEGAPDVELEGLAHFDALAHRGPPVVT